MSSAPLMTTLLALLPTYTSSTLPQPLFGTATALLAQSRSRAATLKPEEEVARVCVCAEIACRRLQTRLNLPNISSHPPCPPRVYKKLYQYLDKALVTPATAASVSTSATSTPTKRKANVSRATLHTPSKMPTKSGQRNPTTPNPSKKRKLESDADGPPPWVAPTIRHLCKLFAAPAAVPHVFVGVISILQQRPTTIPLSSQILSQTTRQVARPRSTISTGLAASGNGGIKDDGIPALIAAVLFLVLEKMKPPDHDRTALSQQAAKELVALGRITVAKAGEVVAAVERAVEEDWEVWREMEWWGNVPVVGEAQGEEIDNSGEGGEEGVTTIAARSLDDTRATGLGAIDWLSDARRREYRAWKARMLTDIENIEREDEPTRYIWPARDTAIDQTAEVLR